MEIKEFIQNIVKVAKAIIEKVESCKELSGKQKKERTDEVVTKYITGVIDTIQLNFVFKLIFKKLLIENIPTITQAIFDLVKVKVEGITE